MTIEEFAAICREGQPPASLPDPLRALFWDARGDWAKAHTAAQGITTPEENLVDEEWRAIAMELCARPQNR